MMMKKLTTTQGVRCNTSRKVVCVAVCDSRKKYETRIANKVKENVNKLMVMGAVDFKMMYEMLKEADKFHKEKMDGFMKNMNVEVPKEDDVAEAVDDAVSSDSEENIFVDKQ
jgi:hypothetical protein